MQDACVSSVNPALEVMPNANTSFDDNQITDPNHKAQYTTYAPEFK